MDNPENDLVKQYQERLRDVVAMPQGLAREKAGEELTKWMIANGLGEGGFVPVDAADEPL